MPFQPIGSESEEIMQLYDPPDSDRLAEGKTKIIYRGRQPHEVIIRSKDDITAGDGAKRDRLAGKAEASTRTTVNCFRLLQSKGIWTHYREPRDELSFYAEACNMFPVEVVTRRIAYGSYLKRNPEVTPGRVFNQVLVEFFLKDDARHDPLMTRDPANRRWRLHSAKQPIDRGRNDDNCLGVMLGQDRAAPKLAAMDILLTPGLEAAMRRRAMMVFLILEHAWAEQDVTLVDMKVEFGCSTRNRRLLLADVITNDEWRIWPGGDDSQMRDKQVYRDLDQLTPEARRRLKDNYRWVADATHEFVRDLDNS